MKRVAIVAVVVLIALAAAWWFTRPKPVAVALVTVERGAVIATVANTRAGTVDACHRARLSPALGGQIARLPVKKGERVAADALLLELWNDVSKLNSSSAHAMRGHRARRLVKRASRPMSRSATRSV